MRIDKLPKELQFEAMNVSILLSDFEKLQDITPSNPDYKTKEIAIKMREECIEKMSNLLKKAEKFQKNNITNVMVYKMIRDIREVLN